MTVGLVQGVTLLDIRRICSHDSAGADGMVPVPWASVVEAVDGQGSGEVKWT
jgi:hypothetical protein